jgi:phospholipid/cholesterol/gamma-HCH transport system substrate-binding protein
MEARAHHFLVGLFVLVLGSALVAFTLWVAKVELGEHRPPYYVFFDGSVTGLKEGSPVRYRGILVGTVSEIRIDPDNVERVRVTVNLDAATPIKTDAEASLEMSGLTGGAYVQISGGSRTAPAIVRQGGRIPVIASKASGLAEVFETAPHIAHQLTEIGDRLTRLLSPDNERRIADSVDNLHQMSTDLAASARDVSATMTMVKSTATHLDGLMGDVRQHADAVVGGVTSTLTQLRTTLDSVDGHSKVAMTEVVKTSAEARELSQSLRQLSDQMAGLIKENRVPVRDFTSVGLYELSLLISEMRELTTSLSRVSSQIEKGPMQFLFAGSKAEPDKPK